VRDYGTVIRSFACCVERRVTEPDSCCVERCLHLFFESAPLYSGRERRCSHTSNIQFSDPRRSRWKNMRALLCRRHPSTQTERYNAPVSIDPRRQRWTCKIKGALIVPLKKTWVWSSRELVGTPLLLKLAVLFWSVRRRPIHHSSTESILWKAPIFHEAWV